MADVSDTSGIVCTALQSRRTTRADRMLVPWFLSLDLSPDSRQIREAIAGGDNPRRLGLIQLPAVCRRINAFILSYFTHLVRCYRCERELHFRFFSSQWVHTVWLGWASSRACRVCSRTGERCGSLPHPNCYHCRLEWTSSGSSD